MTINKDKILLHACCAVCMAYPLEILKEDYNPIVFFSNSNIYPQDEYQRRKQELIDYCDKKGYSYIIDNYEPDIWQNFIAGLETEKEKGLRCDKCFEFRLERTAQKAIGLDINTITTTLTVSPHKISKNIFKVGNLVAEKYNIKYLEKDFKKQNGFLKTMELAKENNFYRQQYCGCKYSIRKENI